MELYTIFPPGFMDPNHNGGNNNNMPSGDDKSWALAMAYVPVQSWQKIYEYDKGLMRGTIFEQLDLPFKGANGHDR